MRCASIIATGIIVFSGASVATAQDTNQTSFLKGQCAAESHIAEGAVGDDLTKRQSRFFCDSVVITVFGQNVFPKHVMVQFVETKAVHGRQIGYAGQMSDENILDVANVYLEEGRPSKASDGACKFFYSGRDISSIACGAKIDQSGRRTVPVVLFDAALSSITTKTEIDCGKPRNADDAAFCQNGRPYQNAGAVNCSLPGTIIEFGLDGSGAAEVTRIESNFEPMRNAARLRRVWSARLVERDDKQILVLDNGERTRIMVSLPDGKGKAFVTDANGLSDILCQVLVRPSDGLARGAKANPSTQAPQSVWPPIEQQFPSPPAKSAESDRLMYCVNPEIQYGQYSSYDGGKSAMKILEGKCKREYLDFLQACERSEDSRSCVLGAAAATQLAIKRFGK
jgi:hypothetical protein